MVPPQYPHVTLQRRVYVPFGPIPKATAEALFAGADTLTMSYRWIRTDSSQRAFVVPIELGDLAFPCVPPEEPT